MLHMKYSYGDEILKRYHLKWDDKKKHIKINLIFHIILYKYTLEFNKLKKIFVTKCSAVM